jgi:predicted secreted protein
MRLLFPLIVLLAFAAPAAFGHEPERDDHTRTRVQIDARSSMEVENDVMRAVLFAQMEDVDSARLTERLNRAVNEALRAVKSISEVKVRSGGYNTFPITEKGKIVRWQARSELILESGNFKRMSDAIARAQGPMQLADVEFLVSPEARARSEAELTQQAISEFLAKAERVGTAFKGTSYHVAEATVSTDAGIAPPPRPMAMKSLASESRAAPEFESGTSRITVIVSGAILIPR